MAKVSLKPHPNYVSEVLKRNTTHNLWILSEEVKKVLMHLEDGTYEDWYRIHLDNSFCVNIA